MNIPALLQGLGWSSLVENMWFSYCQEAVCMFYVNIKRGPGPDPAFFTTVVFNYEITVTHELLATTLDLPHSGLRARINSEFGELGFDFDAALESHTRDIAQFFPSCLTSGRLPYDLKALVSLSLAQGGSWLVLRHNSHASGRLVDALVDVVVTVIKRESSSGRKQTTTLDSLRREDLMWPKFVYEYGAINDPISSDSEFGDVDGISEYESPPEYPL
ncbi:unnamed protein product [Linum trigynum]|uniref:Uncharacterized protein n=1 Tax=Linum trigynum TaxID=586398 RepID=A0AAV2FSV1_9ROSI